MKTTKTHHLAATLLTFTLGTGFWITLSDPAAGSPPAPPAQDMPPVPGLAPTEWPPNPIKHQVSIRREKTDKRLAALIAAAEAVPPSKEALPKDVQPKEAAASDNVWWYQEQLGIRIPFAITADTVTYYSDLVGNHSKQAFSGFFEPNSRLDYHATAQFHKAVKLGEEVFKDVYVVTLKLNFENYFTTAPTMGMQFQKQRVVIFNAEGKVVRISGDGPTEVPILAR